MEQNTKLRKLLIDSLKTEYKYLPDGYADLVVELIELTNLKNKGYNGEGRRDGSFRECERMGLLAWEGLMVRMGDKISRMYNLARNHKDSSYDDARQLESLKDTLMDLANYALFCVTFLEEGKLSE